MADAAEKIHRIRLVGPWEWSLAPVSHDATWTKVRLPDDWGALAAELTSGQAGALFRRRFHRPTGIGPADRVYIVIESQEGLGEVCLNGQPLEDAIRNSPNRDSRAFEITKSLDDHNTLEILIPQIEFDRPERGLSRPVILEIVANE